MTIIKIGGRSAEEIIAERLKELAQNPPLDIPRGNGGSLPPAMGTSPSGFSVEDLTDRYRLHNVVYEGKECTVDWSKALLDGGNNHTQDDWVNRTKDEEFRLAPGPLYGASMLALHGNKDVGDPQQKDLVNRVATMFKSDFDPDKPYMTTSTRVIWTPQGPDEVYHRYGYPDMSQIDRDLVGPNEYIGPGFEDFTDAMLGTRDVATLEHAVTWLTGMKPYVLRFNQRPQQREKRVLRVGCVGSRFIIYTDGGINYGGRPARGVVVRAVASSGAGGA